MSEQIQTEDKITWLGFQDIPEAEKNAALAAILNPSETDRDELYRQWNRKAYWRPEEAAAMLGGVPPEFVEQKLYKVVGADFASKVEQLVDDIRRQFSETVDPAGLVAWAVEHGIDVPVELRAAFPSEQPKSRKSDQRRTENTHLKMLLAMAIDQYGYSNKPNDASSQIAEAARDIGLPVSDDTVRRLLNQATELDNFDWAKVA